MSTKEAESTRRRMGGEEPSVENRSEFLTRHASSVGALWSVAIRRSLSSQGRDPAGGFPGTMSEMRQRIGEFFHAELRRTSMVGLTVEERESSTRIAYAAARKDWAEHRVSEPYV